LRRSKLLIINCDDFGQSPAMNKAIMHLLEERKVSSATIMTPAPGFEEAAEWCRRRGQSNIGLHLTFTSEFDALRFPSLTGHSTLHDDSGNMHKTIEQFERKSDTAAFVLEIEAQYQALRKFGFPITHVDNHMGSLYGMATGRSRIPQVLRKCAKWGLPFRLFRKVHPDDPLLRSIPGVERIVAKASSLAGVMGVAIPDYLLSHPFEASVDETYERFKQSMMTKMYNLPDGISETYIHPAVDDPDMRSRVPHWEKRVWEYQLMLDEDFTYAIKDAGVILTDYSYIHKHGRASRFRSAWVLVREMLRK
jgi:predicted glycoside hydrolase/deacetylase ChbG (UPF0249 family)